jgi:RNA polymerase sigma-70 factor (ECF subfamily)
LLIRLQAVEEDPEAWRRFVGLYQPLLLRWCQKSRLQPADAEDVTQDVFRTVREKIAGFRRDPTRGTFRGWLRTITKHAICDLARTRTQGQQGVGGSGAYAHLLAQPDAAPAEVDEERDRDEERVLLREALRHLLPGVTDPTREAFWQVMVEGRRPAEVAQQMGVKEHVVYLAKSRILRRLKDVYGELLDL